MNITLKMLERQVEFLKSEVKLKDDQCFKLDGENGGYALVTVSHEYGQCNLFGGYHRKKQLFALIMAYRKAIFMLKTDDMELKQ